MKSKITVFNYENPIFTEVISGIPVKNLKDFLYGLSAAYNIDGKISCVYTDSNFETTDLEIIVDNTFDISVFEKTTFEHYTLFVDPLSDYYNKYFWQGFYCTMIALPRTGIYIINEMENFPIAIVDGKYLDLNFERHSSEVIAKRNKYIFTKNSFAEVDSDINVGDNVITNNNQFVCCLDKNGFPKNNTVSDVSDEFYNILKNRLEKDIYNSEDGYLYILYIEKDNLTLRVKNIDQLIDKVKGYRNSVKIKIFTNNKKFKETFSNFDINLITD